MWERHRDFQGVFETLERMVCTAEPARFGALCQRDYALEAAPGRRLKAQNAQHSNADPENERKRRKLRSGFRVF